MLDNHKKALSTIAELQKLKDLKDQIAFLVQEFPKHCLKILKAKQYSEFDFEARITKTTPKLSDNFFTLQTKVYWIIHDIADFPLCEIDGKPVKANVKSLSIGYGKIIACCKECENKAKYKHITEANLKKYGSKNPYQFCKDKIKKRNLERYGTACPANSKEIREEIEKKNLEKYGVKSYSSAKECRDKVAKTNLERYGVTCSLQGEEAAEKTKQTNLKNWGSASIQSSKEFKEHVRSKLISKYGIDYGKKLWGGHRNAASSKRAYSFMLKSQEIIPLFTEEEYVKARSNKVTEFRFQCKHCGKTFTSHWDDGHSKVCPYCGINGGTSKEEKSIFEFLRSFLPQVSIKLNDRTLLKPLEVDFYVPKKNIAIEFDGLYWHNDDVKTDFKYHLHKTEQAEKQGVQLIHIFEDEWLYKQDIVKSRLKNLFGVYDKSIFARKCEIREVDSQTSKKFQEENHLQGAVNSKLGLGLFFDDELVSLMSFGKCRFDKRHEWELLRFCNKLGYHVVGGASKLLKCFERKCNPKSLVSYADRRWSQGKLYQALGFKFSHNSLPNYWYFRFPEMMLQSRVKFQKHRLKELLKDFDESKTEVENMKSNNYFRIFDCGNMVFEKNYRENADDHQKEII